MKTKKPLSHRILAIFLLLNFLPGIFPLNYLWASNNGPTAPEATSFEPVDATDMVNLVTGDFSYVLPLLNVPSPEGGYPLALSYHGGIAMEQEASWVGLGWNLNPGAVNRNVNGYPDDWGKTNVSEFFYDNGWEEKFYEFGIGATIYGVDVGLGASWGSNRSLGGYVSAGYKGAKVTAGTNGWGVGYGYEALNLGFGSNGFNIGLNYGMSVANNVNVGGEVNYNSKSGFSVGIGAIKNSGRYTSGIGKGVMKSQSVGINFSSEGISTNFRINGNNAGINNFTNSISNGDYHAKISRGGFELPLYVFYIKYGHNKVRYSLFKYNNLYTTGMLYPYHANLTKEDNSSYLLYENNFMDVNTILPYRDSTNPNDINESDYYNEKNNIVFPNYDNYVVNAQGLSGSIKPSTYKELILSARGRGEYNNDNLYNAFVTKPYDGWLDRYNDLGGYSHFYFENTYNSFLRIKKGNLYKPSNVTGSSDYEAYLFQTGGDYTYDTDYTPSGDKIMSGNRLRKGNFIQTFTNKQIRDGGLNGFIEASDLSRQNKETYNDEGIGAYRITTMDGKTYHYSLPVYNYEMFYKNFDNLSDEDEKFFEVQKRKPYATHWLLTAVTGPDYVDSNNNGVVDESDYGYWVEFEYGKWSDGYMWKGPREGYEVSEGNDGDTYSYYWGRKQVYYLDAVRTRTHTALFVKGLRDDGKSSSGLNKNNIYYSGGTFDYANNPKKFTDGDCCKPFAKPGDTLYRTNNTIQVLESKGWEGQSIENWAGRKSVLKYVDAPISMNLKLDKILILNNKDVVYSKNKGSLTSVLNGKIYINESYNNVQAHGYGSRVPVRFYENDPNLYVKKNLLKTFQTNIHTNILDKSDIVDQDLESHAEKIIAFNFNYELGKNSSNSNDINKGRLTLEKLNFKGKKGVQVIPSYDFSYYGSSIQYNKVNKDAWGYHKTYPQLWSLNQITTPLGGIIKVNYESDSYYAEAAYSEPKTFNEIVSVTQNSNIVTLNFPSSSPVANLYFKPGRYYNLKYTVKELREDNWGNCCSTTYNNKEKRVMVNEVGSNWVSIDTENQIYGLNTYEDGTCGNSGREETCVTSISIDGLIEDYTLINGLNGKSGGGLRVKSIQVLNAGKSMTTEYAYKNPITGKTTGITSYAPSKESKGIPYISEIPAPTVMYSSVTMSSKDDNNRVLGWSEYTFESLNPFSIENGYLYSLGDAFKVKEQQNQSFLNNTYQANKYTIYNKVANIGRLIEVISYNSKGQIIGKRKNNYKKAGLDANGELGVTQESYKGIKRVRKNGVNTYLINSSSKVSYPSVLASTSIMKGGFSQTTYMDKHDFLTGNLLESRTLMSDGTEYKVKSIPAYHKYLAMGGKVDNALNMNMLTQKAASFSYIKDGSIWKETGVGVATWKTWDNGIWRKHANYTWKGDLDTDGTLLNFSDNFDWSDPDASQATNWQLISKTTKYDNYSMPLEVQDINGNRASTKMGDKETKVFATGNAAYKAMFYSGAEDLNSHSSSGGVSKGTATVSTTAHTGKYALHTNAGAQAYKVTAQQSDDYKVSVWVYNNSSFANTRLNVGGTNLGYKASELVQAGNWKLLTFYPVINSGQTVYLTSTSGAVILDDFRMHPITSTMTSYVYNEWDELTYILGANNLATKYEYDQMGRLIRTYQEVIDYNGIGSGGFKMVSEHEMHYKNL